MPGSHLTWLSSRERFGVKLGLDSVQALLAELGDPHIDLPAVLVAGTNGKGSTAAMIAAVLTAAGRKTLLYTSPHVASVSERIRVDGKPIRRDALERRLGQVRAAVTRMKRSGRLAQQPTYFEVMTAAALLQARAARVTGAVFEVGLGGRYDATNVIPAAIAVITGIELDHTEFLGTTLKKIAWNKAGIIKKDQTVLTLESRPDLLGVFRRECRLQGAKLIAIPGNSARRLPGPNSPARGQTDRWNMDLGSARRGAAGTLLPERLSGVSLGLRGPRQGPQAVLALAAAGGLLQATAAEPGSASVHRLRQGPTLRPLAAAALRRALAGVHLRGRFELRSLSRRRTLVADAAHNPAAAVLLADEVRQLAGKRPVTLLFGALDDKDAAAMLRPLLNVVDNVNLTSIQHRRGMKTGELQELALCDPPSRGAVHDGALGVTVFSSSRRAWRAALKATPPGGILLVAGSFYLLGELWPFIRRHPLRP